MPRMRIGVYENILQRSFFFCGAGRARHLLLPCGDGSVIELPAMAGLGEFWNVMYAYVLDVLCAGVVAISACTCSTSMFPLDRRHPFLQSRSRRILCCAVLLLPCVVWAGMRRALRRRNETSASKHPRMLFTWWVVCNLFRNVLHVDSIKMM